MSLDSANNIRDQVIANVHSVDDSRVSPNTLTRLQTRVEETMNDVAIEILGLRDWSFRYAEMAPANIGPGLGSSADTNNDFDDLLPSGWANEGRQGGLWRLTEPLGRLVWKPLHEVTNLLRIRPTELGPPLYYSISKLRTIRVFPTPDMNYSIGGLYARDLGGDDFADFFPERAMLALYRGTAAEELRRKGNVAEYAIWKKRYDAACFDLICEQEQGMPDPRFLPRYAGAADVYPYLLE